MLKIAIVLSIIYFASAANEVCPHRELMELKQFMEYVVIPEAELRSTQRIANIINERLRNSAIERAIVVERYINQTNDGIEEIIEKAMKEVHNPQKVELDGVEKCVEELRDNLDQLRSGVRKNMRECMDRDGASIYSSDMIKKLDDLGSLVDTFKVYISLLNDCPIKNETEVNEGYECIAEIESYIDETYRDVNTWTARFIETMHDGMDNFQRTFNPHHCLVKYYPDEFTDKSEDVLKEAKKCVDRLITKNMNATGQGQESLPSF